MNTEPYYTNSQGRFVKKTCKNCLMQDMLIARMADIERRARRKD